MSLSIREIVSDSTLTALTYRQPLEPVEGREAPVFGPTYPPPKERKTYRHGTPYTVNETAGGVRMCDLDSVQSQANRMESAFTGALADVVPHHVVEAGNRRIDLTRLPHRLPEALGGIPKSWWSELAPECVAAEIDWLREHVYHAFGVRAPLGEELPQRTITAFERWRRDPPTGGERHLVH